MIKHICPLIILVLFTGILGKENKPDTEQTCSYNVIIPTKGILKKCEDYAEEHLRKLRNRYDEFMATFLFTIKCINENNNCNLSQSFFFTFRLTELEKQIADNAERTKKIDLFNKCDQTESKVVYESKTQFPNERKKSFFN